MDSVTTASDGAGRSGIACIGSSPLLVGRSREQVTLHETFAAASGRGRLVLLGGGEESQPRGVVGSQSVDRDRMTESMTFGGGSMATDVKLVRVQDKGQVTLPAAVRRRLGLKKGDLVAVEETSEGVLITPQALLALRDLDRMGAILREQGITLDEWMESGRTIREELYHEKYGSESPTNPD